MATVEQLKAAAFDEDMQIKMHQERYNQVMQMLEKAIKEEQNAQIAEQKTADTKKTTKKSK